MTAASVSFVFCPSFSVIQTDNETQKMHFTAHDGSHRYGWWSSRATKLVPETMQKVIYINFLRWEAGEGNTRAKKPNKTKYWRKGKT